MGNRASSTTETINLPELRRDLLKWKSRPRRMFNDFETPWTESHLTTVLDYALKLEGINSSSDFAPPSPDQIWPPPLDDRSNSRKFSKNILRFQMNLRELLKVPDIRKLPSRNIIVNRSELVAAFTDFLLRLWLHDRTRSLADQVDSLRKELRYLVGILGDTPFSLAELEKVRYVLVEFENVANLVGGLVYCFVFTTDQQFQSATAKIRKAMDALFQRLALLKANISFMLPYIVLDAGGPLAMNRKADAVGDPLLFIDSIICDIENLSHHDGGQIVNVKDQIEVLHHELMFSLSAIKDMRGHLLSGTEAAEEPVVQLIDVAYEAEYLIKLFLVENIPLWYFTIRLPHITDKMKLIGSRLQEITRDFNNGFLKITTILNTPPPFRAKRNNESSDLVIGFDDNVTNVLDQVMGGGEQLQIISIYGMAGLGKTTLARKIYNHPSVSSRFDKHSWFIVSQTYHRRSVLNDILTSSISELDKDTISNMEEEELADHLYKCLKGRRFLIVLDDIWSPNVWYDLLRYFPDDANGSRVLFTTRDKDVAPNGSIIYALPSLLNDQCWELLEKKVFKDKPCPMHLQEIGKKIAKNCGGLPLAVVVIAGILSTVEKEKSVWEKGHLKPCFLYFGAFPAATEVPAQKLMMLWIAEGFVKKGESKSAENVAEEYLIELIDRSLVMVAKRRSDGGFKACVIHDLLHDFCLRKARETNFLKLLHDNYTIYERHHRVCFHALQAQTETFRPFFGPNVRSFFGHHRKTKPDLLSMKLLRVLDLEVSDSDLEAVKFLVHLRYLSVNQTPFSISNLVNLEYLIVKTSRIVDILPVILKMTKLRHLQLAPLAVFDKKCDSYRRNSLEYLSNVSINNVNDENMVRCSPNLRKLKSRCQPFLDEHGTFRYHNIEFLTHLESLKMTTLRVDKSAEINFPSNIKKLTLDGQRLAWDKMSVIGRLENLEVLKLKYNAIVGETWKTRDGEFEKLRFLKLEILDFREWNVETWEHFPSLERLVIRDCYNLRKIPSEIGEIPTLGSIEVQSCLKSLARSAKIIEQEQREMGNEEIRVVIGYVLSGR